MQIRQGSNVKKSPCPFEQSHRVWFTHIGTPSVYLHRVHPRMLCIPNARAPKGLYQGHDGSKHLDDDVRKPYTTCHPERSEESVAIGSQMLRFAQHDRAGPFF
jgi:hypothetical protein